MPGSDWLHRVAVRGCVIAGVVLLTAGVGPCESQETRESETKAKAASANGRPAEIQPEANRVPEVAPQTPEPQDLARIAAALEAMRPDQNSKDEQTRAARDLDAQEEMARWTLPMLVAAALQALIGAIGICYIRKTLDATRELSAAENRAWMVFDDLKVISNSRATSPYVSLKISGTIKNIGKSPAFNIMVGAQGTHAIEDNALIDDVMFGWRKGYDATYAKYKRTLFPDERPYEFTQSVEFNIRSTEALYRRHGVEEPALNAAMIIFFVFYNIVGDDKPHETTRAYLVGGLPLDKPEPVDQKRLSLIRFDRNAGSVT